MRPVLAPAARRAVSLRGENGITKIALGHHRDDIVETLFLNMFFGGKLKAMPPKLRSDDGRHIVIRPLAYVAERDIERYARGREFPIIPCKLCGSQDNMQRVAIKKMLREWEQQYPGPHRIDLLRLRNVVPSHLADPRAADFSDPRGRRSVRMSAGHTSCSRTARTASRGAGRSLRWPKSRERTG